MLDKLAAKEICSLPTSFTNNEPILQKYFQKKKKIQMGWKPIYILPHIWFHSGRWETINLLIFTKYIWINIYCGSCAIILVHGTIVPKSISLVKNRAKEESRKQNTNLKVTWEQLFQSHLGTISLVSLEKICVSVT